MTAALIANPNLIWALMLCGIFACMTVAGIGCLIVGVVQSAMPRKRRNARRARR